MTFIVNILHEDFSIICSDRKASSEGPTTIKANGITIHAEKGATIHGFKKLYFSRGMTAALGISGNANQHSYIEEFEKSEHVLSALTLVRSHMEDFLQEDYTSLSLSKSFTSNEAVGTYYSSEVDSFFSNIFEFSPIHNYTRLYMGSDSAKLISVGSGGRAFSSDTQLEELKQSFPSNESLSNIQLYLAWIKRAYREVSAVDEHTGEEVIAFLATKGMPLFVEAIEG